LGYQGRGNRGAGILDVLSCFSKCWPRYPSRWSSTTAGRIGHISPRWCAAVG